MKIRKSWKIFTIFLKTKCDNYFVLNAHVYFMNIPQHLILLKNLFNVFAYLVEAFRNQRLLN